MRYTKILLGVALLSLITLFSSSCNRTEEELFDRSASERMLDLIESCEQTLTANSNGWEMTYEVPVGPTNKYAPQASFVIQMQFKNDKTVETWADYNEESTTSSYSFTLTRGPVLSFDTYGAIHDLSNPAYTAYLDKVGEDRGRGFFGEFDFEIRSVSKEKIVLRGLKYRKDIVLTPLSEAPSITNGGFTGKFNRFTQEITKLGELVSIRINDEPQAQVLFYNIPNRPRRYVSPTHIPTFSMQLTYAPTEEGAQPKVEEYEVTYTEGGFKISPAIELNDKQHDTFIYIKDIDAYVSSADETVTIKMDLSVLSNKLLNGVFADGFFITAMSDELQNIAGPDKLEEIFKGYISIQWYNMPNLKSLTFFHRPDGTSATNTWQDLNLEPIEIVDDANGIYRLPITGNVSGNDLFQALMSDKNNAAKFLAQILTSFGRSTVTIKEVATDSKIRMISSTYSKTPGDLWIEFQAFGN